MKLTDEDKVYLKSCGYRDEDISQIEMATRRTKYTLSHKKISAEKAIELLGRKTYLNGIARSAFHYTAARQVEGTNEEIYFDSSQMFK